jgi:hypothetical protein
VGGAIISPLGFMNNTGLMLLGNSIGSNKHCKNALTMLSLVILCSRYADDNQGDRIGRFFAHWAIVYLEQGSYILAEVTTFSAVKVMYFLILTKTDWA